MKTHLVLHHSLTEDSGTLTWNAIRRFHTQEQRWADIGYHYGVERVGSHIEMLVGRPLLARAAAAYQEDMNRRGVHVCFVGNFDENPPTSELLDYAAEHLADICEVLGIPLLREHVIGHCDVAPYKSCPGKLFDIDAFLVRLQGAR